MLGDVVPAYIVKVRPDRKLDLSFRPPGALPKLEAGAAATIKTFQQRAFCAGVDCSDIVKWHEGRFGEAGPDAKWQQHIEMFKPGGRYYDIEKILLSFVDEDGYTGDGCDAFASYQKK